LGEKTTGYDTGCGNILMDSWISYKKNLPFDKNGQWARLGEVNQKLLDKLLSDKYFLKNPPKSTGREYFNKNWLQKQLEKFIYLSGKDIQATLLELTAKSIAQEVKKTSISLLIVCGGGLKNIQLMKRLKANLKKIEVVSSDECGISSEYMEAMAFAWFAYKRIHKEKVKLSSITGASKDTILGALYE